MIREGSEPHDWFHHAAKQNTNAAPVQLGVALTMAPKSERFLSNAAANEMFTRPYRKPYVVPEKV
jgi:hypothetical protein